jgi:hypothetical protein
MLVVCRIRLISWKGVENHRRERELPQRNPEAFAQAAEFGTQLRTKSWID